MHSYAGRQPHDDTAHRLAQGLGWFSIGLGLAEFLAPRTMARLTGVPHPRLLRLYGLREIAAGVGIFGNSRPSGWLWARVAGDALDLATIGAAMAEDDSEGRTKAWIAAAAVAGVTALDVLCAAELTTAAES
jgi:hypothetical protein